MHQHLMTSILQNKITTVKKQFQRIASFNPLANHSSTPSSHVQPPRVTVNQQCPSPLKEKLLACSPDVPRFDFAGQSFWVRLHSIHDGDTVCIVTEIDSKMYRMTTRLMGIDTPEIRTKDLNEKKLAIAARNRVASWALPEHFQVDGVYTEKEIKQVLAQNPVLLWMKCRETEKWGRTLAELFKDSEMTDCINYILIKEGYGDVYEGGRKARTWDVT